jgi:hypothetical protein
VTLTFDLWPWKSIGCQTLLRTKYVPVWSKSIEGWSIIIPSPTKLRMDIVTQRYRPSFRNILVNTLRINILQWILTKLDTYLVLKRICNPIDFQGAGEGIILSLYNIYSETCLIWTLNKLEPCVLQSTINLNHTVLNTGQICRGGDTPCFALPLLIFFYYYILQISVVILNKKAIMIFYCNVVILFVKCFRCHILFKYLSLLILYASAI